jgi:hypothetical protein
MLTIIEIISEARQGITKPFLCRCDDGHEYFVKRANAGRAWDEKEITEQIKIFESRRPYRLKSTQVNSLGRRSPDPRVLSLQELLRAMR